MADTTANEGRAALPSSGLSASLRRRLSKEHLLFAVPAVLLVVGLFALPLISNAVLSFTNWTSYSSKITFAGLGNFQFLVDQGYLQKGIQVTLTYAVVAMAGQNLVAIILALALRETNGINSFFRALFFIPVLISPVAGGYIWRAILAPEGTLNAFIGLAIPGFDYAWLGSGWTALPLVALVDAWKWSGLTTLVYIAGLNSIPKEVNEAAVVDGANPFQRFFQVTLPLLGPAITFNIAITLITALSAYDVIASMTVGGPGNDTTSLFFVMRAQFGQGFFGMGSALALVVTVLVVTIAIPLVGYLRHREVRL